MSDNAVDRLSPIDGNLPTGIDTSYIKVRGKRTKKSDQLKNSWSTLSDRKEVHVSGDGSVNLSNVLGVLYHSNQVSTCIFVRYGSLVRVVQDEYGLPSIHQLTKVTLRIRLYQSALFKKVDRRSDKLCECYPPDKVVEEVLELRNWELPPLVNISPNPIVRRDGSLCTEPGYDSDTGLYFIPDLDIQDELNSFKELTGRDMGSSEISESVSLIRNLYVDFPFSDNSDMANCIAEELTRLIRYAIDGNKPMSIYEATKRGTGKTLLAALNCILSSGYLPATASTPQDEHEWRKFITSEIISGSEYVILDNVKGTLESQVLEKVLTSGVHEDRILGKSEIVRMRSDIIWCATGNQMSVSSDVARRSYRILIDAKRADPENRDKFVHPQILQYAMENRPKIIRAFFILAIDWYRKGCPMPATYRKKGSFEEWSRVVSGILYNAGIKGFLENDDLLKDKSDTDEGEKYSFFKSWYSTFSDRPVRVLDVYSEIQKKDSDLSNSCPGRLVDSVDKPKSFNAKMGTWLKKQIGTYYRSMSDKCSLHLEQSGMDGNKQLWKVVESIPDVLVPALEKTVVEGVYSCMKCGNDDYALDEANDGRFIICTGCGYSSVYRK